MVPFAGWGATVAKWGRRGMRLGDAGRGVRQGAHLGDAGRAARKFYVGPHGVADVFDVTDGDIPTPRLERLERIDYLVGKSGTNIQTHPLRQEYQRAVKNIPNMAYTRKAELGLSEEATARYAWSMRRELGERYKNATPLGLRDYIYVANKRRYQGDPLGPSFEYLLEKYRGDYDLLIAKSGEFNTNVDGLLRSFGPWLNEQSSDHLDRYVQDLRAR
jgi:hypothetical protein